MNNETLKSTNEFKAFLDKCFQECKEVLSNGNLETIDKFADSGLNWSGDGYNDGFKDYKYDEFVSVRIFFGENGGYHDAKNEILLTGEYDLINSNNNQLIETYYYEK